MDIHYNAFISYRHHPDDIRVAMEIHRGLERFKIPKAIRKKSAPLHLFRDKEELPITSHLTEEITRALENSEFLIVICSPHTKESVWVQREIETFLKTHSRDKVLTVLASGEPYEVIPDILLHEDVLNPVTGQIQREEIEPLSCDWRMKKRKAVREELPRLAAPLLDCAYDELKQRQRQYRMRRTIAAFSVALAASLSLTAYFIYTSIQIQKANDELHAANLVIQEANVEIQNNLDQALRNQSQYLASSSTERMAAGDRLTALALALEALPSEQNPRPYVPEAEFALSNALSSYQQTETFQAQGSFDAGDLVRQYLVSDDGSTLYILNHRNLITVWDTVTFEKRNTIDASAHDPQSMYLTKDGNLLFTTGNLDGYVVCYSSEGALLWKEESCRDMAFLDNRQTLILLQYDQEMNHRMLFVDPETGAQTAPPMDLSTAQDGPSPSGFFQEDYAAGQPIVLRFTNSFYDYVYLARPQTGELIQVLEADTSASACNYIYSATADQNGNILVMRSDGSGTFNGNYGTYSITSADHADIFCFDGNTLKQKWQSQITTHVYTAARTIAPVPDSQWVLCQSGNTFQLYDSLSGSCLLECQTPSVPLHITVDATETWGILENGTYFSVSYDTASCYTVAIMDDPIDMAVVNRGYFVHSPLDWQVTVYRAMKDDACAVFPGEYSYSPDVRLTYDRYLMIRQYGKLFMLDIQEQKLLWEAEPDSSWQVLGFSRDGSVLWMRNRHDNCARAFQTQTGETRDVAVFAGDLSLTLESNLFLAQDSLLFLLEGSEKMELHRVDLNTGIEAPPLELPALAPQETDYRETTRFLAADDSHAWIWKNQDAVYTVNLHTGQLKQIRSGVTERPEVTVSADQSSLLLLIGNEVLHANMDGTDIRQILLDGKKGVSACSYQTQYLVLCDDGTVCRYDRQGTLLSQTPLNLYSSFSANVSRPNEDPMDLYWWLTDDGDVVLNAFGAGNIIDSSQWQVRAFVPNLFACSENADTLICCSNQTLYAYSRYTTAQQMDRARQLLGNFQLSEEDRKAYGLN